jgi:hypothetical protein
MSRYIVWDAGKGTADIYEMETDYDSKALTITLENTGVKAEALMNIAVGSYSFSVVSPGKWEKMVKDAKDKAAVHDPNANLEMSVPVKWVATTD